MTNDLKEKWLKSEIAERIMTIEMFAINHGFSEWKEENVLDFFLSQIKERDKRIVEEIAKEHNRDWIDLTEEVLDVDSYRQGLMEAIDIIEKEKI